MPAWTEAWKGGRVYLDRDGQRRYVIERMRHGRRYTLTLAAGVTDPEAELALFKRDPEGYSRRNVATGLLPEDSVVLTADEIERFEKHQREEGLSEPHVRAVSSYLSQWAEDLAGRDLRQVLADDLYAELETHKKAKYYRATAIKAFCSWKVSRQRLPIDNAAAHLQVTRAAPARTYRDVLYTAEQIQTFYAALTPQRVRDYFLIAAMTGLHGSEIGRIPEGSITEMNTGTEIAAVISVKHKVSGKTKRDHRQSVTAQVLAAARRLVAAGVPCKERVNEAIHACARRLKRDPVHIRYLRHSFITLTHLSGRVVSVQLGNAGVPIAEVAAAVGHRTSLMIQDHYLAVPSMKLPPLRLSHSEDPAPLQVRTDGRSAG